MSGLVHATYTKHANLSMQFFKILTILTNQSNFQIWKKIVGLLIIALFVFNSVFVFAVTFFKALSFENKIFHINIQNPTWHISRNFTTWRKIASRLRQVCCCIKKYIGIAKNTIIKCLNKVMDATNTGNFTKSMQLNETHVGCTCWGIPELLVFNLVCAFLIANTFCFT